MNIKIDELILRLGITIRYGPTYSPWSNSINEKNHACCDVTVKKLMEDKKEALTNSLVRTAAWMHSTNVAKLGYTPLQLVAGKSCNLPGLTIGKEATESVLETELVQKVRERLLNIQAEFREA